jgi:hypothetical protein
MVQSCYKIFFAFNIIYTNAEIAHNIIDFSINIFCFNELSLKLISRYLTVEMSEALQTGRDNTGLAILMFTRTSAKAQSVYEIRRC